MPRAQCPNDVLHFPDLVLRALTVRGARNKVYDGTIDPEEAVDFGTTKNGSDRRSRCIANDDPVSREGEACPAQSAAAPTCNAREAQNEASATHPRGLPLRRPMQGFSCPHGVLGLEHGWQPRILYAVERRRGQLGALLVVRTTLLPCTAREPTLHHCFPKIPAGEWHFPFPPIEVMFLSSSPNGFTERQPLQNILLIVC